MRFILSQPAHSRPPRQALDSIMYSDLRPFWPFSPANPFFEALDLETLHARCLATGAAGILLLTLRARRRSARGEGSAT
jgi:hypothetical protein